MAYKKKIKMYHRRPNRSQRLAVIARKLEMRQQPHFLRRIIPCILATITQKPRYLPLPGKDFWWSKDLWVHNIFRVYEQIFFRRWGIRCEMASGIDRRGVVTEKAFTFEATCALIEVAIRKKLAGRKVRIILPKWKLPKYGFYWTSPGLELAGVGRLPGMLGFGKIEDGKKDNFKFAIAIDATSENRSAGNLTHTCTGSNLFLMADPQEQSTHTVTAAAYNGVSMTEYGTADQATGDRYTSFWGLVNPATGSHDVAWTGSEISSHGASYTGVGQGIQPDSTNHGHQDSTTSFTISTTVVDSNCWLIAAVVFDHGSQSAGSGTTLRIYQNTDAHGIADSNGTVGTGSQSLIVTSSPAHNGAMVICSITPTTHTPITGPAFLLNFV